MIFLLSLSLVRFFQLLAEIFLSHTLQRLTKTFAWICIFLKEGDCRIGHTEQSLLVRDQRKQFFSFVDVISESSAKRYNISRVPSHASTGQLLTQRPQ